MTGHEKEMFERLVSLVGHLERMVERDGSNFFTAALPPGLQLNLGAYSDVLHRYSAVIPQNEIECLQAAACDEVLSWWLT